MSPYTSSVPDTGPTFVEEGLSDDLSIQMDSIDEDINLEKLMREYLYLDANGQLVCFTEFHPLSSFHCSPIPFAGRECIICREHAPFKSIERGYGYLICHDKFTTVES